MLGIDDGVAGVGSLGGAGIEASGDGGTTAMWQWGRAPGNGRLHVFQMSDM